MTPDEAIQILQQAVSSPARVDTDGLSIQERPLGDVIEALKTLQSMQAQKVRSLGIRIFKAGDPGNPGNPT